MTNCNNCNNPVSGNFCSTCGQAVKLKRIDNHYISHEIQHLLHFEKGFFYTVKELLLKPGGTVREYITYNRSRHIKPIPFLIFTSLIYTLINSFFHIETGMIKDTVGVKELPATKSSVFALMAWVQGHYGYANILMGGLIALFLKVFFRKYNYNIFEITVLLCFVMGEGMLLYAVFSLLFGLTKMKVIFMVMALGVFGYTIWAIGQFYDSKKVTSYIKVFFSYFLGAILFYIILIAVGILYDYLTK